jgi:hypothetical protein
MKIVIPVSSHDEGLIDDFCDIMKFFAPYKNHELLIVARPSDVGFASKIFDKLNNLFSEAQIHVFDKNGTYGWPQGPNHYWKETIKYLEITDNKSPWLWMELDCTPIKKNWIDLLEEEYQKNKSKCLGMIQDFIFGQIPTSHLVGVAIYPPDFNIICNSWKNLDDDSLAFDVYCQDEIMPISVNSKLMQHNFRTYNYTNINKNISGEIKEVRNNKYNFHRAIEDDVVLVHGCDDGSLARIIMNL